MTVLSTGSHSRGWADFLAGELDRQPLLEAMRSASIYAKRRSYVASALAKRASMDACVSANRWSVVASRALISDRGSAMSALATTAPSRAAASAFTILLRAHPTLARVVAAILCPLQRIGRNRAHGWKTPADDQAGNAPPPG